MREGVFCFLGKIKLGRIGGRRRGLIIKQPKKSSQPNMRKKEENLYKKSFKTTKVNFQFLINFSFVSVVLVAVVFVIKKFS